MADAIVLKRCSHCKTEKPVVEFYRCKRWPDGLDYNCKVCRREMNDASVAKAMQTPEGRERLRATTSRWHKKKRLADPEWAQKRRDGARRRYRANKERHYCYVSARKAKLVGGGGSHSCVAWRQMLDLFGHRCLCCGKTERVTKDHIVPVARGGTDDIRNLQPLCIWCNKSKFTRDRDYRTRDKVALAELNVVGKLLFEEKVGPDEAALLRKKNHKPASKYTGVYYQPKTANSVKVWRAKLQVDGRKIELGRYATAEEAAAAYNEAAKKHRGENACLNDVALGEKDYA